MVYLVHSTRSEPRECVITSPRDDDSRPRHTVSLEKPPAHHGLVVVPLDKVDDALLMDGAVRAGRDSG